MYARSFQILPLFNTVLTPPSAPGWDWCPHCRGDRQHPHTAREVMLPQHGKPPVACHSPAATGEKRQNLLPIEMLLIGIRKFKINGRSFRHTQLQYSFCQCGARRPSLGFSSSFIPRAAQAGALILPAFLGMRFHGVSLPLAFHA